jgi:hypothetical protein
MQNKILQKIQKQIHNDIHFTIPGAERSEIVIARMFPRTVDVFSGFPSFEFHRRNAVPETQKREGIIP